MASAELFNREIRANKSPRNAFNVGYSTLFTSPAGMLLPCYVEEVKAGDKLKLGLSNITRTRPLNTSAFMTFDEKVDFWYIPYSLLFSDYESWRIGQTFRHRTTQMTNVGVQNLLPYTTYPSIANFLRSFTSPVSGLGVPGSSDAADYYKYMVPNPADTLRFLDLLSVGVPRIPKIFKEITNQSVSDPEGNSPLFQLSLFYDSLKDSGLYFNYFRLAAYQCVYMHCYRNEEYEQLDPSYYNVDNLFSRLDFNNDSAPLTSEVSTNTCLANNSPSGNVDALADRLSLAKLFTPRFKNWRRDLFTCLKPDSGFTSTTGLEFGRDGSVGFQSGSSFYWPQNIPGRPTPDNGTTASGNPEYISPMPPDPADGENVDYTYQMFNKNPAAVYSKLFTELKSVSAEAPYGFAYLFPQNIRNLMAQDRFSRASIYADKDYKSQMKALFGEDVDDYHRPRYLGSYSTNISISDVTATANGTDSGAETPTSSILGQVAGKGYNGDGSNKVFESSFDHDGVVMGIHYVMPRNNYDSYRINRFNTKISRWDYFYPQFDGLGFSPVFAFERNIFDTWKTTPGVPGALDNRITAILGYGPRYAEYKQRTNEVHGAFQTNQADMDWTLSNNFHSIASGAELGNYKIAPTITNRIFAVKYDGSSATDHFMHYYDFNVTRISNMEVYGTPSL